MSLPNHRFLDIVVDGLRNDIPNDFSKLSRNTVQHARKELMELLRAVPGANYQNVKLLRAQLSIAEQGQWTQLNKDLIEDAALEYYTLLKLGKEAKERERQRSAEKVKQRQTSGRSEHDVKPRTPQAPPVDAAEGGNVDEPEDYPVPVMKRVDTAELFRRKQEQERQDALDNEEVPMPRIRHIDTAELLRRKFDGPSLADLGLDDEYRPTRLAEMYMELYDNEWTDALEELMKDDVSEVDAIHSLLQCLEFSYDLSKVVAIDRRTEIRARLKATHRPQEDIEYLVLEKMKSVTEEGINHLQKNLGDEVAKGNDNPVVRRYIDECVRLTYLLNIQHPPMELYKPEKGSPFNSAIYKAYTKQGTVVDYTVWPVLLLCAEGAIAAKGIVQPS